MLYVVVPMLYPYKNDVGTTNLLSLARISAMLYVLYPNNGDPFFL
jgi:hypothetical protein